RAPGATQAYFALESAMDEVAARLEMDPIELRLRNVSREGDPDAYGGKWPRIASVEVLEEAQRHPVYTAPLGDDEAVGVALGSWGGARTPSAAGCRVEPDGTVSVTVGSPDISGTAPGGSVEITRLVALGREFMGRHKPVEAIGRSAVQAASPTFTVHLARVRAEKETGSYHVTGYAAIQDVGHAINPPEIAGQIHGG